MNLTYIPFSYYFRMNYNLKKKKEKSLSVTNVSTYLSFLKFLQQYLSYIFSKWFHQIAFDGI